MSIMYGDNKAKLYLGDVLLNRTSEFKGYTGAMDGIPVPEAGRNFDPTKSYDIIFCFWLGEDCPETMANAAAFGTYDTNSYYSYPSLEITIGTGIWYGVSVLDYRWDPVNKHISMSFARDSYNYVKLSHDSEAHTITLSYSTDGETWTVIDTNDISGVTLLTTSKPFCFGCNAKAERLQFPGQDYFHMRIEKCKIISDGEVLFGYED